VEGPHLCECPTRYPATADAFESAGGRGRSELNSAIVDRVLSSLTLVA
jgi:hypothetical protein